MTTNTNAATTMTVAELRAELEAAGKAVGSSARKAELVERVQELRYVAPEADVTDGLKAAKPRKAKAAPKVAKAPKLTVVEPAPEPEAPAVDFSVIAERIAQEASLARAHKANLEGSLVEMRAMGASLQAIAKASGYSGVGIRNLLIRHDALTPEDAAARIAV
jgi:hypothetical protein